MATTWHILVWLLMQRTNEPSQFGMWNFVWFQIINILKVLHIEYLLRDKSSIYSDNNVEVIYTCEISCREIVYIVLKIIKQRNVLQNNNYYMHFLWSLSHRRICSYQSCLNVSVDAVVEQEEEWLSYTILLFYFLFESLNLQINIDACRIWASHRGGFEDSYLLRHNAV